MSILDTINARHAVQKQAQDATKLSPLERIAKAIQEDVVTSNTCLVQKDWAKWNDKHKQFAQAHTNAVAYHDAGAFEFKGQNAGQLHSKAYELNKVALQAHTKALNSPSEENTKAAMAATGSCKQATYDAAASTPEFQPKGTAKKQELVQKDWAAWNAKEKAGGNNWEHKQVIHEYGAKVRGLGSPTQSFNHYVGNSSGDLKKVTPTQFHAAELPDKTSDSTKEKHHQHLASQIKQFNHKVEYNSWLKASPRTDAEKIGKLKTYGVTKEEYEVTEVVTKNWTKWNSDHLGEAKKHSALSDVHHDKCIECDKAGNKDGAELHRAASDLHGDAAAVHTSASIRSADDSEKGKAGYIEVAERTMGLAKSANAASAKANASSVQKGWGVKNQLRGNSPDSNIGWKKQQAAFNANKPKKPYLG